MEHEERATGTGDKKINAGETRKTRTVRFPPEADRAAVSMASELGITVNELLRRALGTERFLIDAQRKGSKILIKSKDDEITEVVMR